jgi:hypothetical protein
MPEGFGARLNFMIFVFVAFPFRRAAAKRDKLRFAWKSCREVESITLVNG